MNPWRVLAAATVVIAFAGCAQAGPGNGTAGGSRSGRAWSTEVGWPFSLAVRGRDVVVTVGGDRVVALDGATGRERWRTDVTRVTHYEPALDGHIVLVSADDRFIGLTRASGARRWEAPVGEHAGGAVLTRVGSEPIALVTTERGMVAALDGRTGQPRWSVQLPGDIWAEPAAGAAETDALGAVLWAGAAGETVNRLRVFDLATGAVRWESGVAAGATAPVVHDGLVVLGEGNGNFAARVVARDLASGAERWSVPAPASFESGVTPGARGDDVVVSDHFGTLTLVDTHTGKPRWQTAIREPILDTRVVLGAHTVVIRTYGGKVVVVDRDSGRIIRRVDPAGFPVGAGTSAGRLIFAVRLARPDRVEAIAMP
jgi:outer membrane protein assembly factor BamB